LKKIKGSGQSGRRNVSLKAGSAWWLNVGLQTKSF